VQERGEASRDALLDAAMELVAERGLAGLSHRAVAERAGVSSGMTSYFFASLDELGREAIIRNYAVHIADLRAVIDDLTATHASPALIVRAAANILTAISEQVMLAHAEVCLNAARRDDLRDALRPMLSTLRELAEATADVIGIEDRAAFGRSASAIVDGIQLRRLAEGISGRDELEHALLLLGTGLLATQAEPERWRARLDGSTP